MYYTIGGTLSHRLSIKEGGEGNRTHKYIDRRWNPRAGKWDYVYSYTANQTPGSPRRPAKQMTSASIANLPYTKYKNEAALSRRTSGNTSSVAKAAYRAAYATGNGRYGKDILRADQQVRSAVSSVKGAAKSTKNWVTKQIDWAGQQASQALSSARSFISNLMQKIGASASFVAKWAGQKALSGVRAFGQTGVGKAIEPYVNRLTNGGLSNPGRLVKNTRGTYTRVGTDTYGNPVQIVYHKSQKKPKKKTQYSTAH